MLELEFYYVRLYIVCFYFWEDNYFFVYMLLFYFFCMISNDLNEYWEFGVLVYDEDFFYVVVFVDVDYIFCIDVYECEKVEFGGFKFGFVFFGWFMVMGIIVFLIVLVVVVGVVIGFGNGIMLDEVVDVVVENVGIVGIVSVIVIGFVLLIFYFVGGYVVG